MDDKPSQALRAGRSSSMRLAIDAVHNGEAAAVVSAGNTGALMAMAKFVLRTLPGIDRPAIASFFPTMRGESVMLDLGANVRVRRRQPGAVRGHGQRVRAHRARRARADDRPAQCRHRGDEGPRGSARRGADPARSHAPAGHVPRLHRRRRHRARHRRRGRDRRLHRQRRAEDHRGHGRSSTASSCATASRARWMAGLGYLLARPALNACARGSIRGATMARSSWASTASA